MLLFDRDIVNIIYKSLNRSLKLNLQILSLQRPFTSLKVNYLWVFIIIIIIYKIMFINLYNITLLIKIIKDLIVLF